jgi:predicted Ser/Thr protein kinase
MSILPPRYRNPERVGLGGMGEIYRAEDETLGRAVAVKLLAERYAADEAVRERFTREALAAARLSGEPHTVTIYDVGEHEERPFIVMEYLRGGSLEDRLREHGAQEPERVLDWLEEAGAALDAAHERGVIHRDVKPGNLLLAGDGTVRVADFGVASATGLDSLTAAGTVLGTAGYLAPEQARGEPTTRATDLYALAVVAFELLTGRRPFEADTPTAEAAAHVHAEIPEISRQAPGLPRELDPVFSRALAKDPAERYASSADLVAALRGGLTAPTAATQVLQPAPAPPRPAGKRFPVPALVGGALLAAAVAGAGLAAALTRGDGDDNSAQRTVTRVTTVEGEPTTETVVTTAPEPPPPPPPARGEESGQELTDRATELMEEGRYDEALPIAQRALRLLAGSGETYEGYANYNVGRSLVELGRCEEALPYLDRREQLLGAHPDVTDARRKCGVR